MQNQIIQLQKDRKELASSLDESKDLLNDPDTAAMAQSIIPTLEEELLELDLQIVKLQKEHKTAKSKATPNSKTKGALFDHLDSKFSLTRNGFRQMKQADQLKTKKSIMAETKAFLGKENKSWAASYLSHHIPIGESLPSKVKTSPTKSKESLDTTIKNSEPEKSKTSTQKKGGTTPLPDFSYLRKSDLKKANTYYFDCDFYIQQLTENTLVELYPKTIVTAKKGNYLVWNNEGYLFTVLTPTSFGKRCQLASNRPTIMEKDYQKLKSELEKKQKLIEELKAKNEPSKSEKSENDIQKKATSITSNNSEKHKKKTKRPKTKCTLEASETGHRVTKIINWFLKKAEDWQQSQTSEKIVKILRTKGEKGSVLIAVKDWQGVGGLFRPLKYYRLCVDTFSKTKVDPPKPGTYRLIVGAAEMKKVYTTRGEKKYIICLKSYRALLKCSLEGTCTADDKKKWSQLYHECGDLVQKLEKQPEAMRAYFKEVKSRRKKGEAYHEAAKRTANELKVELATP